MRLRTKKLEVLGARVMISNGRLAGQCGRICKVFTCGCWILLDREYMLDGESIRKVSLMFDQVRPDPEEVIYD